MPTWVFRWPVGANVNSLYVPKYDLRTRRIVPNQRTLNPKVRQWKEDAMNLLNIERKALPEGDLGLWVWSYPPTQGKHDNDNLLKVLCDAIAAAYGFDDQRFVEHHVYRMEKKKGGELVVEVAASVFRQREAA